MARPKFNNRALAAKKKAAVSRKTVSETACIATYTISAPSTKTVIVRMSNMEFNHSSAAVNQIWDTYWKSKMLTPLSPEMIRTEELILSAAGVEFQDSYGVMSFTRADA
jgi:hypothetical protein